MDLKKTYQTNSKTNEYKLKLPKKIRDSFTNKKTTSGLAYGIA